MAYRKHDLPKVVTEAKIRLTAMEKIDNERRTAIEYGAEGRSLTSAIMREAIAAYEGLNDSYNKALEEVDRIGNRLKTDEDKLKGMYAEVLLSAKGKFGIDSTEVEQLGGTRKSERKKIVSKQKAVK